MLLERGIQKTQKYSKQPWTNIGNEYNTLLCSKHYRKQIDVVDVRDGLLNNGSINAVTDIFPMSTELAERNLFILSFFFPIPKMSGNIASLLGRSQSCSMSSLVTIAWLLLYMNWCEASARYWSVLVGPQKVAFCLCYALVYGSFCWHNNFIVDASDLYPLD